MTAHVSKGPAVRIIFMLLAIHGISFLSLRILSMSLGMSQQNLERELSTLSQRLSEYQGVDVKSLTKSPPD